MKKILIIEDEEQIRRVLLRVLSDEDRNFDVKEAVDGKEALSFIKKENVIRKLLIMYFFLFSNFKKEINPR